MNTLLRSRDPLVAILLIVALGVVYWLDSLSLLSSGNNGLQVSGSNAFNTESANPVPSLLSFDPLSDPSKVESVPKDVQHKASSTFPPQENKPPKIGGVEKARAPKNPPLKSGQPEMKRRVTIVPYTKFKGQNIIEEAEEDNYGNAKGSGYDLAQDGAFKGLRIAVLHLYTEEGFDFLPVTTALKEKGFEIDRWANQPPPAPELKRVLHEACQLWIISDKKRKLGNDHLAVIRSFFESGRGVYIWGDNDPYFADANYIAYALFGGSMSGNVHGDQVVHIKTKGQRAGLVPNHMISTGLTNLYEGITIATVEEIKSLQPVVYGSGGNLVVAAYDRQGNRALLDGGFTRLFLKWDTAGTGRYVKNAAAWLVNYERFGRSVFYSADLSNCVARLKKSTREEIIEAMRSTTTIERIGAIVTASERNLSLFDELITLLSDPVEKVRQEARSALVKLAEGRDYGPAEDAAATEIERSVTQWMKWNSWRKHRELYSALSDDAITVLLSDTDVVKRWAAVSEYRNRRLGAHESVIALVRDSDASICEEARLALVALTDQEYDFGPRTDQSEQAKHVAFTRWSKWWKREHIIPNYQLLDQDSLLAKFQSPMPIDRWAALTVARRRKVNVPESFLELIRDEDNEVRQEARHALVSLADGKDYGPQDRASARDNTIAAEQWTSWWSAKKARIERIANNRLRMAKTILEVNEEKGRLRLKRIVEQYYWTESAKEARRILEKNGSVTREK